MKCGLEAIGYALPNSRVPVESLVQAASFPVDYIHRLYGGGLCQVPDNEGRPLPCLVRQAASKVAATVAGFAERTCAVLYAHSLPVYGPAEKPVLAMCLEGLGLEQVPRIAVGGQPCAVLHMGIRLAMARLSSASHDAGVLVLGGDVAYQADERLFFGSAMGDAAVAAYVTQTAIEHRILAVVNHTKVVVWEGELSPNDDIALFRLSNPSYIRAAIEQCLHEGGIELRELRAIIPHTPNLQIWDTVARLLRFPREKIITEYLPDTGHLSSNDSLVHYARAIEDGRLQPGDLALLVNPGFGGSRGCTLLQFQGLPRGSASQSHAPVGSLY